MNNEKAENGQEQGSKKKLVRTLIIIGIGIPVLIELLTLFNLVKVKFWEEGKETATKIITDPEFREISAGDTLFTDEDRIITLDNMRMDVDPTTWLFTIRLTLSDFSENEINLAVDSLMLNSGRALEGKGVIKWEKGSPRGNNTAGISWEVPSGDIPRALYYTVNTETEPDSVTRISRKVKLGNIPVRYRTK